MFKLQYVRLGNVATMSNMRIRSQNSRVNGSVFVAQKRERSTRMAEVAIKNYTERDFNLLLDIFNYRMLTINQINKLHFGNRDNIRYIYLKMHLLKKEGLITTQPIIGDRGRKIAAAYLLTDKGISFLYANNLISHKMRAKELRAEYHQLQYIIDANDLYAELKHHGWKVLDSRATKRKYNINRANLIQGSLTDVSGVEYGFYTLSHNPEELTVVKILNEINNSQLKNILVFCKSQEAYKLFVDKLKELKITTSGVLGVLPFVNAPIILKKIKQESDIVEYITNVDKVIKMTERRGFTRYLIVQNGEERYLANYLYGDQMLLYTLYNYYSTDTYQKDGRKVTLLAWKGQDAELRKIFINHPHIQIETIAL